MMAQMKRGRALFFVGIFNVCLSVTLSLSILSAWAFSDFPKGSTITLDSFIIANFLIGVVCVIIGIIGGFLIGRNWREFREALA